MRLARFAAALVLLAVFAPPAHAQSKEALALADHVYESAGLAEQLRPVPAQFERGILEQRGKLPEDMLQALAEAGKKSFAAPRLHREVVAALARRMSAADMKEVLAWLDAPLGRRVTGAEVAAASSMTPEAMEKYFEQEKSQPSGPKRVGMIAELITSTNSVEIAVNFIETISLGVAVGMDATQPVEKQIGIARLRERMRIAMPTEQLRATLSASIPGMYRYTYRDISDEDLAAYVKFNAAPLGLRYNKAVTDALAEVMTQASVRVGELVKTAPERKKI